ncbi:1861_t:CDS:2, partial [Diversispora eburnea]
VNLERKRYNFETYWNEVIDACKIKQELLDYEIEKDRILYTLFEINNKIKTKQDDLTKNSSKWKIVSEGANSDKDS